MTNLSSRKCTPCQVGAHTLKYSKIQEFVKQVPTWKTVEEYGVWKLHKDYEFEDFAQAMKFVNKVADVAEAEGHHPNIWVHDWNKLRLELYTHKIKGLHENDFILATKIDKLKT